MEDEDGLWLCGVCDGIVKSHQASIACLKCKNFVHLTKCAGLTYAKARKVVGAFQCSKCLVSETCFMSLYVTKLLKKGILGHHLFSKIICFGLIQQDPMNLCQSKVSVIPLMIYVIFWAKLDD